jgi:cytochrome P450
MAAPKVIATMPARQFTPPTIAPPAQPMSIARAMLVMGDNPLKIWDQALFHMPHRAIPWQKKTFYQVMDPALIQAIYVDHADIFPKSPMQLRVTRPGIGEGLLTVQGPAWRRQRRAASPVFRAEALKELVPIFNAAGETAAISLAQAGPHSPIDVMPAMTRATLEVIAHAVLAADNPSLDLEQTAKSVTQYVETIGRVDVGDVFGVPHWARPDKFAGSRAIQSMRATADAAIAWRRSNPSRGGDLLYQLMHATDPETGEHLTEIELRDNVLTFIAAGHETTSLALTWALYLIANAPDIQDRLYTEIHTTYGTEPLCSEALTNLPFHEAVVKEAMRLFPPVSVLQRIAAQDVSIGTIAVRKGDLLASLIYVMQRSHLLYDAPAMFVPDRFLDHRADTRHRFAWMPFGAGPRICIGLRLAMMESVAILATLVRRLEFSPNPNYIPMPLMRLTLRPHAGMPLHVRPR